MQRDVQTPGNLGGYIPLPLGIIAGQQDGCRPGAIALQPGAGLRADSTVRPAHQAGRRQRHQQRLQALIQMVEACQVVQHALIHAQAPPGQAAALVHFQQAPAAQRLRRHQRIPVGGGQQAQGQTEGRPGLAGLAVGLGAEGA